MRSEKQIKALEEIKKEARENMEKAFKALSKLSETENRFVSNTEVACFMYPNQTYSRKFAQNGKEYKQNTMDSTVMNWLKRLVNENRVETKLWQGKRWYKPKENATVNKPEQ